MSESPSQLSAVYDMAIKIAFPILLGVCGWAFSTLWDHGNRITAIEASRYSRSDAKNDLGDVQTALAELQIHVAGSAGGQKATADRLTRIEDRLSQLVDVIHTLESKVLREVPRARDR